MLSVSAVCSCGGMHGGQRSLYGARLPIKVDTLLAGQTGLFRVLRSFNYV